MLGTRICDLECRVYHVRNNYYDLECKASMLGTTITMQNVDCRVSFWGVTIAYVVECKVSM